MITIHALRAAALVIAVGASFQPVDVRAQVTASPSVSPTVSPSPTAADAAADAAVAVRAKDWIRQIQVGKIDRSQLNPQANAAFTDAIVAQASTGLQPLGDPTSFALQQKVVQGNLTIYVYRVEFKTATLLESVAVDENGKIAGLRFAPEQSSP